MDKLVIKYEVEAEDGEVEELECPAKYVVCGRCEGKGTHCNPAVDGHGISREEFDQDPGFEEDYFNGVYDITCERCGGERVELIPDENSADKAAVKKYMKWQREQDRIERERLHEIEMGVLMEKTPWQEYLKQHRAQIYHTDAPLEPHQESSKLRYLLGKGVVAGIALIAFHQVVKYFSPRRADQLKEFAIVMGMLIIAMVVYKLLTKTKIVW